MLRALCSCPCLLRFCVPACLQHLPHACTKRSSIPTLTEAVGSLQQHTYRESTVAEAADDLQQPLAPPALLLLKLLLLKLLLPPPTLPTPNAAFCC